jgi:hypothetical protein
LHSQKSVMDRAVARKWLCNLVCQHLCCPLRLTLGRTAEKTPPTVSLMLAYFCYASACVSCFYCLPA